MNATFPTLPPITPADLLPLIAVINKSAFRPITPTTKVRIRDHQDEDTNSDLAPDYIDASIIEDDVSLEADRIRELRSEAWDWVFHHDKLLGPLLSDAQRLQFQELLLAYPAPLYEDPPVGLAAELHQALDHIATVAAAPDNLNDFSANPTNGAGPASMTQSSPKNDC